jgi:hypothetical protein
MTNGFNDEELIARLRDACYLAFDDGTNDYGTAPEAADRIEALNEQLAAARQDAKEAEAYVVELEKQCEGLMRAGMNNWQALILAEANLAKAVEALRQIADPISLAQGNVNAEIARATLAEIKGESHE